jgi:hypothetical protein
MFPLIIIIKVYQKLRIFMSCVQLMKLQLLILSVFFVSCNDGTIPNVETELEAPKNIKEISFHFEHSLRIPNYKVDIEMNKRFDGIFLHVTSMPMTGHVGWDSTRIDTTYKIDQALFDKVLSSVGKISSKDLQSAGGTGDDGTSCEIRFGDFQNYTSYVVWTPNYDSKKRKTEDFLNACREFIKAAKLDSREIL